MKEPGAEIQFKSQKNKRRKGFEVDCKAMQGIYPDGNMIFKQF